MPRVLFLLATKRVSIDLHDAWLALNATRYKMSRGAPRRQLMRMWLLRSRMAFLLTNVQYYLQVHPDQHAVY